MKIPRIPSQITDILRGSWVALGYAILFALGAGIPHFIGRWTWVHVVGWDSPTNWTDSPAPLINWMFGMTILFLWFPLMKLGRSRR